MIDTRKTGTIFIHAANIHVGGGKALLNSLLKALPNDKKVVALFDARMMLSIGEHVFAEVRKVKPRVFDRMAAELWLWRKAAECDIVLCMGNLPPLFKLRGKVFVFLQNRYLVDPVKLKGFSALTRLRIHVERLWLRHKACNVDTIIVQTPSMHRLAEPLLRNMVKNIHVLPFVERCFGYERSFGAKNKEISNGFIYVASGDPHKNHRRLIEAWCMLHNEGYSPSLTLTIDESRYSDLYKWIREKIQEFNIQVFNMGVLPHHEILQLYKQMDALIYPSTFESFGLPLIEARQAGLPILASEFDYVRDVIDPEETFDPGSAVSIARAVKRFLLYSEEPLPLKSADDFMSAILERSI